MRFNKFDARVPQAGSCMALLVLMLVSFASINAQAPGSSRGLATSDGFNQIQGRVHFPSGRTFDSSTVKVSLESVSNFGSPTTVTDQN